MISLQEQRESIWLQESIANANWLTEAEKLADIAEMSATATSLGGKMNAGAVCFFKVLMAAVQAVNLRTNGKIPIHDLCAIFSPADAVAISRLENSWKPGKNAIWGLPDSCGGVELVVESAAKVSEITTGPAERTYLKKQGTCLIVRKSDNEPVFCITEIL